VTNPKMFRQPTPIETALGFAELVRTQPNCVPVEPSTPAVDRYLAGQGGRGRRADEGGHR
jgi:hypothetical protein